MPAPSAFSSVIGMPAKCNNNKNLSLSPSRSYSYAYLRTQCVELPKLKSHVSSCRSTSARACAYAGS